MINKKLNIYSLTLSLNDWTPRIRRKFWVRGDIRLDHLSYIFFSSMGWSGYHLSAIIAHDIWYSDLSTDDPPPEWKDWEKYTLQDIVKDGLTQFQYMYDFGDGWQMTIKVREEKNLDPDAPYPVCVNGENAGPPEDVGSYSGFEYFVKVMKNKKHKEHERLSEWWGADTFDSSHFSTDEINAVIQDQDEYQDYVKNKFS